MNPGIHVVHFDHLIFAGEMWTHFHLSEVASCVVLCCNATTGMAETSDYYVVSLLVKPNTHLAPTTK